MHCENMYCIYQKDNACTLDEIALDSMGMCSDCILVNIDTDALATAKEKLLAQYDVADNL